MAGLEIQQPILLCNRCKDFDYDQMNSESGYPHHKSLANMIASAKEGCKICAILLGGEDSAYGHEAIPDSEAEADSNGGGGEREYPVVCKFKDDLHSVIWTHNGPEQKYLASFVPCTTVDDSLSVILRGRVKSRDVLSEGCLQMARDWLNVCGEEHQKCPKLEDYPLPTRVIDVGSIVLEPRLIVTAYRSGRWTALSHCWGSSQTLKTEAKTLESHCRSLPLSNLPPTFREAIIITRALGIQYVWIDSLCILQDSRDDWLSESVMMGAIFKNAVVTIAADASLDSSVGIIASSIPVRHSREYLLRTRCHSSSRNLDGFLYLGEQKFDYYGARGPLSQRGWALQEETLSPRILQFTSNLVFWRCVESRANEIFPDTKSKIGRKRHLLSNIAGSYLEVVNGGLSPQNYLYAKFFNKDVLSYWYGHVVDEYVLRQLTYQSDKLIAIAGMAQEVKSHLVGSEYKAGLWMNDIHRGLLWSPSRERNEKGAIRHNNYIAPSWSWASINFAESIGELDERYIYRDLLTSDISPRADVLEIYVQNANNDPFGPAEFGILTIRSECCSLCACRVPLTFWTNVSAPETVALVHMMMMMMYRQVQRLL